jgi:hypothetical protein
MDNCVCCVWNSLEQVWGSEFATGGFVMGVCVCVCVCVCRQCVGVSRGDLMAAVLRIILLFHEGLLRYL